MDAREPNPANRAGVKGSPAGWAAMRSRMACDVLMAASVLDNLTKYLTVHKAHVVNKKPLRPYPLGPRYHGLFRDGRELFFQPSMQGRYDGRRSRLSRFSSFIGRLASDVRFDLVETRDRCERMGRNGRRALFVD